jgi:hypothetical protein
VVDATMSCLLQAMQVEVSGSSLSSRRSSSSVSTSMSSRLITSIASTLVVVLISSSFNGGNLRSCKSKGDALDRFWQGSRSASMLQVLLHIVIMTLCLER